MLRMYMQCLKAKASSISVIPLTDADTAVTEPPCDEHVECCHIATNDYLQEHDRVYLLHKHETDFAHAHAHT